MKMIIIILLMKLMCNYKDANDCNYENDNYESLVKISKINDGNIYNDTINNIIHKNIEDYKDRSK